MNIICFFLLNFLDKTFKGFIWLPFYGVNLDLIYSFAFIEINVKYSNLEFKTKKGFIFKLRPVSIQLMVLASNAVFL